MQTGKIYLDNAATTPIAKEVVELMHSSLITDFGNPSSIHSLGRGVKAKVELVRKQIAKQFNALPSEIVFTSGGTESNNIAIRSAVNDLGIKNIVTTKIEHPSVLKTIEDVLLQNKDLHVHYLPLDEYGVIDLGELTRYLSENKNVLVSLMHGNNEIGNLLPLKEVSDLCKDHDAIFHTDTVQTIGHYQIDLKELSISFLSCSAHKIHGPKGVGFLYINKGLSVKALITGGKQERSFRAGTENASSILGMGKAMDLAYRDLDNHESIIKGLKSYCKELLQKEIQQIQFNGAGDSLSMNTVLNVRLNGVKNPDMLLFQLDLKGVFVSGGSACSSGSAKISPVLDELGVDKNSVNLRFSFSRFNTKLEIEQAVFHLLECLK